MKEVTPTVVGKKERGISIAERVTKTNLARFYLMLREKYELTLSMASIREIQDRLKEEGEAWIILHQQRRA